MKKLTLFSLLKFQNTFNQSSSEGIPAILSHDFDSLFISSNNASPPWHFSNVIVLEPDIYLPEIILIYWVMTGQRKDVIFLQ